MVLEIWKERVIYFQGSGEKVHIFLRILGANNLAFGIWRQGAGIKGNILGSWGEKQFFFHGAGS